MTSKAKENKVRKSVQVLPGQAKPDTIPGSASTALDEAVDVVRNELVRLLQGAFAPHELQPTTSLVADLNLDSVKFVDLVVGLEEAFDLEEFPMQAWLDQEAEKEQKAFTVADLAEACVETQLREARTRRGYQG